MSVTLAGCDLPQPFVSVPAQHCVSQRQGALGAGGGVIIPLMANDPTSSDHTSALYAVRASDGALAWSCASTTYAGWDDARLVNGVVYAIAGTAPTKDAPAPTHVHAIYAMRPQDGRQLWSYSFRAGSTSALTFDGGMLFVSATTADGASSHGNLYAIRVATGALALNASIGETLGDPIIVDHRIVILVTTASGRELRAISESDGAAVWTYPLLGNQSPAPWLTLNGMLYFSTGAALTAIDGATGATRWTQSGFANMRGQLFSAQGAILFSASQSVFAFDQASGAMRWSAVLGAQPQLLAVSEQMAYAVTQGPDGIPDRLYALNISTGDVLWQRAAPFAAVVTPAVGADVYLTISTGAETLANVVALDQRGGVRWTYKGASPYANGALIPAGATLYYVWQAFRSGSGIADNTPVITYVTALRMSDGSAQWTTPLPAHNTYLLPPLLVS
jgi:outer membrane protein assembly factor BamB